MLAPLSLNAQVSTATVSGSLADSTGAIIPNLTVIATDQATGVQAKAVSDAAGQYNLPFLNPAPIRSPSRPRDSRSMSSGT